MTDKSKADPQPAEPAAPEESPGVSKPWRDEAPDPKRTATIAKLAKSLAKQTVADDQDKAALEQPRDVVDATGRNVAIGVDVGGSGIKAAAVDLDTGELISPRHRVPTPVPSAPAAVIASIARQIKKIQTEVRIDASVPVGVGFPAVVIDGVTKSAANVDAGWVDFDADTALERVLRRPVHLVNDADAAGVAEMRFGAGVGQQGTVFLITLGTGTGSALFYDGMLVPNLELGHMEIRGRDAERRSAAAARLKRGISWKAWAMDLDEHLLAIEKLFSPKLFIIGGGVSKRSERFIPRLTCGPPWCRRSCSTMPGSWAPRWRGQSSNARATDRPARPLPRRPSPRMIGGACRFLPPLTFEIADELRFILDLGVAVALALVGGMLAVRLRQPPIVGYLLAGVVVGPFTPGFVWATRGASTSSPRSASCCCCSRSGSSSRSASWRRSAGWPSLARSPPGARHRGRGWRLSGSRSG